jgi:hypothetical protein
MATRKILRVAISKIGIHFFSGYFTSRFYTKTRNQSNTWKNGEFALPVIIHYFTNSVNRVQF